MYAQLLGDSRTTAAGLSLGGDPWAYVFLGLGLVLLVIAGVLLWRAPEAEPFTTSARSR